MSAPIVKLGDGNGCPQIGLGTWQAEKGEVGEAVKYAIEIGYRHIDCAMLYANEKEIGEAIRAKIADGTIKREDLFITSKLWSTYHEYEKVVPTCKKSLENFGLDYLDLYLVHWPVALKGDHSAERPFEKTVGFDYDYLETWKGMEDCAKLGLARSIGLSNFNSEQVQRVLDNCTIKPVMNQVEMNPNINQKKLIQFCKERNIEITAYSPFGSPTRPWAKPGDPVVKLDDPKLVEIGKKYGKSPAQVVLRFIVQSGAIPIPKSTNRQRMADNLNVFDFALSEEDMKVLDGYDCNGRSIPALEFKGMPHFPFDIEF